MKKMLLLIGGLGMLALASAAFGAEIGDISWDQSNLETLRSFDAAAVARFLNSGLVEQTLIASVHGSDATARRHRGVYLEPLRAITSTEFGGSVPASW